MMRGIKMVKRYTGGFCPKSQSLLVLSIIMALLALCSLPEVAVGQGAPTVSYFTPTGGPAGTEVTVAGDNFTNNNAFDMKVILNDIQAQILRMTDSELVFIFPPGAITGPLKLETSAGTVTTADSFIVSSVTVSVQPARINIFLDNSKLINGTVIGDSGEGVVWSVNGVEGGNETLGTVTQANPATYTAPDNVPGVDPVLLTATSVASPAVKATARIEIINPAGGIPDIELPPADPADFTGDPEIWLPLSRTRIMVLLREDSAFSAVSPLMTGINAEIIGTIPEINTIFLQIPDTGDLTQVKDAIKSLEASAAVEAVTHDSLIGSRWLPTENPQNLTIARAAPLVDIQLPANFLWSWELNPLRANWGMEYANLPQAWNLYDYVAKQNRRVEVGIVDNPVNTANQDLAGISVNLSAGVYQAGSDHGSHVAGIIGGKWDNVGINGVSPFVNMTIQPTVGTIALNWGSYFGNICNMLSTMMRQLIRHRPNIRVINLSQGPSWSAQQSSFNVDFLPIGPSPGDYTVPARFVLTADPAAGGNLRYSDVPPTPGNNPAQASFVRAQGTTALRMANYINNLRHPESGRQMIIVVAAGNDRMNLTSMMHSSPAPGATARAAQWNAIGAEYSDAFSWAAYNGASNIVVVEALQETEDRNAINRASYSTIAGNWRGTSFGFSAPGDNILSSIGPASRYVYMGGTSMAAPHVTGLMAYLYAVDPDLTIDDIMTILRSTSRSSSSGTAAPAIDAFKAVMYIDEINKDNPSKRKWVKKALLNIDDGTADGNDRTMADDAHGSTIGSGTLPPDMRVNMSDFRRFRDAYLHVLSRDTYFDGPEDSLKRDLNGDRVIKPGADENVYPRFDFNGDGEISRSDLEVMADPDLWNDEQINDTGLTPEQLYAKIETLLISGDVKLNADALFGDPEIDSIKVQAKVKMAEGVYEVYKLTITSGDIKTPEADKRKILTLPADKSVQLWATAYKGDERKYFLLPPDSPKEFQINEGEDRTLKIGKVNVSLGPDTLTASYGDKIIVGVNMSIDGVAVDLDMEDYDVAFTISPELGSMMKTERGYQLTISSNAGSFPIKAVVSTKDGEVVNPFDVPFITSEATVITAVIKAPGGLALDSAGNMYVSDTEDGSITIVPPASKGLRFIQGLKRPGDVEVDARGRSIIVAQAEGRISRHYFGLSGKVTNVAGDLLVGATLYIETPAGTLPGETSTEKRFKTNVDGRFHVLGLLSPEMGNDPVKIVVTIEYEGKSQAFDLELKPVGQTIREFVFNPFIP